MSITTKITLACVLILGIFALSFASSIAEVHLLATVGFGLLLFLGTWMLFVLYAISSGIGRIFATK
jgi:hypothetical protein